MGAPHGDQVMNIRVDRDGTVSQAPIDDLFWDIVALVEAGGSLRRVVKAGLLMLSPPMLEEVERTVPESRGGRGKGLAAEATWQDLVTELLRRHADEPDYLTKLEAFILKTEPTGRRP